ncbi:hypothetical protein BOTBODRAFT_30709 [Botryobasidium botryosum FD-172 SS1]|uniref:Uncharacterized protein n=1 Tax=Botryobasidium botryosum (strain FD-172 SS1) TaxID=930990 RepID=A0A067MQ71_BOTB1|nr:hypothetical protein BOTBODRAFT_30709 [Botryobasidium botryosum FD-172 SS1]
MRAVFAVPTLLFMALAAFAAPTLVRQADVHARQLGPAGALHSLLPLSHGVPLASPVTKDALPLAPLLNLVAPDTSSVADTKPQTHASPESAIHSRDGTAPNSVGAILRPLVATLHKVPVANAVSDNVLKTEIPTIETLV